MLDEYEDALTRERMTRREDWFIGGCAAALLAVWVGFFYWWLS